MKPFQKPVSNFRGAPMGRHSDAPEAIKGLAHLERVPFVDGDYDEGGAYWGGGPDVQPLYCAWNDEAVSFFRARDLETARRCCMNATFDFRESVFSEFFQGYVEAAFFSSSDPEAEMPLDALGYTDATQLDEKTREKMEANCRAFIEKAGDDILSEPRRAGMDFWYTRNGHGISFHDDWPSDIAEKLNDLSATFPEVNLYVENEKVYSD